MVGDGETSCREAVEVSITPGGGLWAATAGINPSAAFPEKPGHDDKVCQHSLIGEPAIVVAVGVNDDKLRSRRANVGGRVDGPPFVDAVEVNSCVLKASCVSGCLAVR